MDVGLVIGRGGEVLKRIERESGCKIQVISKDLVESRSPYATITGFENDVKEAKRLIKEILDGRPGAGGGGANGGLDRPLPPGHRIVSLEIPVNKVGLVIGRGGETIKMLQEQSGARITQAPGGDSYSGPPAQFRIFHVSGDDNSIDVAKRLINDLLYKQPPNARQSGPQQPDPSQPHEELRVPNDKVGLIIGK
ncbi:RNA binding protein, heterogenous nuclear RNP-K like protein, partial [Cladochytrium tenue]